MAKAIIFKQTSILTALIIFPLTLGMLLILANSLGLLVATSIYFAKGFNWTSHYYYLLAKQTGIYLQTNLLAENWANNLLQKINYFQYHYHLNANVEKLVMLTIKYDSVKLLTLIFSLPLFLLLITVALIDGLVKRQLRKLGGGRESRFIHEQAKQSFTALLFMGCFLFVLLPLSIQPDWLLLPIFLSAVLPCISQFVGLKNICKAIKTILPIVNVYLKII